MSAPITLRQLIHEAYTAHYLFTNLGFEPGEVFVGVRNILNASPPGLHACVWLEREARRYVIHLCAMTKKQGKVFCRAWRAFCEEKKRLSHEALDAIVHGSQLWLQRAQVVEGLVLKGFDVQPGRMVN